MITGRKYIFFLSLLFASSAAYCQSARDTVLLIEEFEKVISFTAQPYLHYVTLTKLDANPVLQPQDTAHLKGEFYKNNTEIYSNNANEEMYLQDSLMVKINHDRKTIWINKVDASFKEKMNTMPVVTHEMQGMLIKNYTISGTRIDAVTSRIDFEPRRAEGSTSNTLTTIAITYHSQTYLPQSIVITINLKQPVDEEILAALKEQEAEEQKMVQEVEGIKYIMRRQSMQTTFIRIENEKEKMASLPLYTSCISYDKITAEYKGIGKYEAYEITKLF